MTTIDTKDQGWKTRFYTIWAGQLVSTLGSGLTGFAMGVWLYQETESVTLFAVNILAFTLPNLIVTPFAGALADRWDRRALLILSDSGAGLTTLAVWLLLASGRLEIWHIIVTTAVGSAFNAFQWPAYSAAITMLVPKDELGRAGGLTQIGQAISQLFSPAIAGALFVTIGLRGIILIDFATFAVAVITLLSVRIPRPARTAEGDQGRGTLLSEIAFGWRYILGRKGLIGLLLYFSLVNFLLAFSNPLFTPYLLGFTTPDRMGYVVSFAGLGMLTGTLVMSAWGGARRRVHGLLGFGALAGVSFLLFGIRPSLMLVGASGFIFFFCIPLMNAHSQALWQSKVAADVQGRVFAVRRVIAGGLNPIGVLLAGPLAERIFQPLLVPGGPLAGSLGVVYGTGPGRGIGLLFSLLGVLSIGAALMAYAQPRIRRLEDELPDALTPQPEDTPAVQPESGLAAT